MSKFLVKITEISQKYVHVEADDKEDAYEQAQDRWNKSDPQYILTADDFVEANFEVFERSDKRNSKR